ncbi:MAG: O-antigen ligase domain-containing protein [Pseudanabaena sp.]|nr:O-antigen ligase domain-containing protein [Pseudanabaena sp. 42896M_M3]
MKRENIQPENFAEKIVWYSIIWTYWFYLIGGLYILGAVLAWILFFHLCHELWKQNEQTPEEEKIHIPWSIWVWIAGMIMMEVALVIGHLDFNLSLGEIIKSTIGWAKGWALLALYPLVGCLKIRPKLMYRAAALVCRTSLLISIPFVLAFYLRLPQKLYVSPLRAIGGPSDAFFEVMLYEIDPGEGKPRWRLYTPWAPAAGFVANIYFFMIIHEKDLRLRWLGIAGCVVICQISASRLALVCLPTVWLMSLYLSKLSRPPFLIASGFASFFISISTTQIIESINDFSEKFSAARKDSSRVRAALGRIAVYRWENDAPIWGHGVVVKGPHMVEFMPIGSHHSWFGLLYVKGIVGYISLAIPMGCSFIHMLYLSQKSTPAKVSLCMVMVLFFYTFGENLEILSYLFWPGLVMMGIGAQPKYIEKDIEKDIEIEYEEVIEDDSTSNEAPPNS